MELKKLRLRVFKGGVTAKIVSAGMALIFILSPAAVLAQSIDQARNDLGATNGQIDQLQANVNQKAQVADTLEGQVAAMQAQVDAVQAQVNDTNAKIEQVNAEIADVRARMASKQIMLQGYVKQQYVSPDPGLFEVLVSSDNLSSFVDKKEYLEKAQQRINVVLADIMAIKATLDVKKADLGKLNDQLSKQQEGLNAQKAALADLLAKTRNDQAQYQALLDKAEAARERLTRTIVSLMGSGPLTSRGHVNRGDVIGREGSTGFSTGAHVHFGVYVNKAAVNPHNYLGSRVGWPLIGYSITQEFGPAGWSNSHYSFHDGIDIDGGYGAPVLAACGGEIVINGWQPDGFGHYIVIDCGGGLWALTGHMQN